MSNPAEGQAIYEMDREHVFYAWSVQGAVKPRVIESGEGCHVWDYDGNRYLDFWSQLVNTNIGHQHPKVVKAIQDQAGLLTTISPSHSNKARAEAAKRISDLAPANHKKSLFTVGGSEAVENAVRVARVKTGKRKVLAAYRSYHGNTGFAINLTGEPRRWADEYAHDIIAFAKGVDSGYVPLGGISMRTEYSDCSEDKFYPGGLTHRGQPLACAAAVATIDDALAVIDTYHEG